MLRQNLLDQLHHFITTVTTTPSNAQVLTQPSLIKVALNFLDELPATREIVFDYFGILAEIGVQLYVSPEMVDGKTGLPVSQVKQGGNRQQQLRAQEYEAFNMVKTSLQNLIWKGPAAWSPLIANWSLELVAKLSDKYTQRRMTITASCNYWLECSAMHGLLTLINSCFRKLSNTEAETCVETMLNAFRRYPMTFDWIVARLGGCFPYKIIMQILQCGIKRFVDDFRCHLDSEAGILDYMTSCHEQQLRAAFREMLKDGLSPKKPLDTAVVPFLMITTNYSDAILQSLVNVFVELYTDDLCDVIVQRSPLWLNNKMFADMQPTLNNAVLRLNQHGATLLITVAKIAEKYVWCQDFLDNSMQELEQWVIKSRNTPLLADLAYEQTKYMLWKSCLSTNIMEQQTAVRLLLFVSSQHPHIYYQTISQLLRKSYAENPNGIGALMRMLSGQGGVVNFPSITQGFKMVLEDITLQEQVENRLPIPPGATSDAYNTFYNLKMLASIQNKNNFPHIKPQHLSQALNECLPKIIQIFDCTVNKLVLLMDRDAAMRTAAKFKEQQANNNNLETMPDMYNGNGDSKRPKVEPSDEETMSESNSNGSTEDCDAARMNLAHLIVDVLNTIEAGARKNIMHTPLVLKLAVLSVKYFFVGLNEKNAIQRAAAAHRANTLLQRQCSARKIARTACLRELLEGALFYHGHLLGQLEEYELDELQIPEHELLILQNLHTSSGANSNRSVLHSGVIGRGLRPVLLNRPQSCDAEKQSLYLKALHACCADLEKPNNVDGYTTVSLMLVELVSTDVMYNGLPFPDEDFTKVTMERDMQIRRAFITSPVLWAVLGLISTHRPTLCYCSVLLRALCATCLHHWRGKNVNKFQPTDPNDELMLCTKKLLQLLAMGQLIPPPLTSLHMIIEHFESQEIALLLRECIWNYLKDHVPSPALFHVDSNGLHWRNLNQSRAPPQYVDTLRNLMQKKLSKLGQHYYQMFIMSELHASSVTTTAISPTAAETAAGAAGAVAAVGSTEVATTAVEEPAAATTTKVETTTSPIVVMEID
ncbi:integrator complex subunit 5 [Scaptodrosophila lebanonensis]|uniref:Integrator complex subunit 5 n=1 Tax=Drosophila lebanonensis TaxID=7225 RepID=A0A6J2TK62_DROLE|nr:integrator complex subunit 5 [Scaptodrosophila lebanonensis]